MPIKLLVHKSWHVYSAENIARVKRDEAKARGEEEESDRRSTLADSEARLDRMRKKRKRDREGQGEGEKELERQLKRRSAPEDDAAEEGRTPPEGKGKGRELVGGPSLAPEESGKHINFWSEFEAGTSKPTGVNHEAALEKILEKEKLDELTKMYLAKKGEGDMRGWYAREDLKTPRELKEGVEGSLERAYKDGEHKRLSDPLALMNSFLKRRADVLSGASIPRLPPPSSRDRYPSATPQSDRGDLSPVITSLLATRRRKGDPIPPPPEPKPKPSTSSTSYRTDDPAAEAKSRVSSERARAAALIAERKRAAASSAGSLGSVTPRSESGSDWGPGGYGMFNKQATREAHDRRGWGAPGGSGGDHKRGDWGRKSETESSSGGWGEQKRRRDDRDKWGGGRDRR